MNYIKMILISITIGAITFFSLSHFKKDDIKKEINQVNEISKKDTTKQIIYIEKLKKDTLYKVVSKTKLVRDTIIDSCIVEVKDSIKYIKFDGVWKMGNYNGFVFYDSLKNKYNHKMIIQKNPSKIEIKMYRENGLFKTDVKGDEEYIIETNTIDPSMYEAIRDVGKQKSVFDDLYVGMNLDVNNKYEVLPKIKVGYIYNDFDCNVFVGSNSIGLSVGVTKSFSNIINIIKK